MITDDFKKILDEQLAELKQARHETNSRINDVITEVRLDQDALKSSVVALEKNFIELKTIAKNTETLINTTVKDMADRLTKQDADFKEFQNKYYASPAVVNWLVLQKELEDLREANKIQDDRSKEHGNKIGQHEKWFYISFGVLFAGQLLFKYLPILSNIAE